VDTKELGEYLRQCHFFSTSPMRNDIVSNPSSSGSKPTNRLSSGMPLTKFILAVVLQ
jgi:hypothetical protein